METIQLYLKPLEGKFPVLDSQKNNLILMDLAIEQLALPHAEIVALREQVLESVVWLLNSDFHMFDQTLNQVASVINSSTLKP